MDYMDLLSRLGIASAHPGGFAATKRLLNKSLEPGNLKVLEVGCGTGKTACYLAKSGFHVTALDQHPMMLEKAKERAVRERIENITWVQGNVQKMPFKDEAFDLVFAESVTIFTDIPNSFKEYHRVLKQDGRLLDREMILFSELPEPIYKEIIDYFKFPKIPSIDEWLAHLHDAGFRCERPEPDPFRSHEAIDQTELQELDLSMLFDPEIGQGIMKYAELMMAQEPYFRACDLIAYKM